MKFPNEEPQQNFSEEKKKMKKRNKYKTQELHCNILKYRKSEATEVLKIKKDKKQPSQVSPRCNSLNHRVPV
jgi:hypothetical protein